MSLLDLSFLTFWTDSAGTFVVFFFFLTLLRFKTVVFCSFQHWGFLVSRRFLTKGQTMDHGQEACDHICPSLGQIQSKTGIRANEQKEMEQ